jgi:hypothetical protein
MMIPYAIAKKMYVAPVAFKNEAAGISKPVEDGPISFDAVTSAAVVLSNKYGSLPELMPLAVSQTYQSPAPLVFLMRTNLAPDVKPQLIVCVVSVPVYEPTLETPAQVAKR